MCELRNQPQQQEIRGVLERLPKGVWRMDDQTSNMSWDAISVQFRATNGPTKCSGSYYLVAFMTGNVWDASEIFRIWGVVGPGTGLRGMFLDSGTSHVSAQSLSVASSDLSRSSAISAHEGTQEHLRLAKKATS